ncbi:SDR family oxidoreductase [Bacillus cereus]|uniref:beta-ketoacyl synthase N-terminal-like domain-containing protein n=1 Tax=Bacillus sp. DAG6 TaxID=3095360 RepID=UPI002927A3A1|nr:beta-ketoacyl synthase N-terminal-like domain-containing protein [Bacillus sp. DAG6]EKS8352053.1 SDR family oxidoreductase [Bacillus cereus]MEB2643078.1 beta-ketoacyl synthase N-terminal-like domain-containing protein [Bacillus sp. DAG6]HEB4950544.1 SDR family oxidoreductase [Bacillus cereus]
MSIRKESDIAIIGMSLRLPHNISSPDGLWESLINKKDFFVRGQNEGDYLKVYSKLENVDQFAAPYFGIPRVEAELMDPQQRILLELAKECFDNAGVNIDSGNRVGVFTSSSISSYLIEILTSNHSLFEQSSNQIINGNHPDNIPTRISYKLGLHGPSMHIGSGCSSSLSAVVQGVQSLLSFQSDLVLVGAASVRPPQERGYLYKEGGINSRDGFCRPYSNDASGTIPGEGAGMVLLKRLDEAIEDGDHIYSVISASAMNNDGNRKAGFSTPSIDGQMEVLQDAYETFEIDPNRIQFIEGHGTGTLVGDPIELVALSETLGKYEQRTNQPVYIGSIKSNIGHTDSAAGIFGLIKAALSTYWGIVPPTINFASENERFNWKNSRLRVNTNPESWNSNMWYAGVTSLGVGGTNVHVVLRRPFEILDKKNKVTTGNDTLNVIPVSSKEPEKVTSQMEDLLKRIEATGYSQNKINELAITYRTSVKHDFHRGCLIVSSEPKKGIIKNFSDLRGRKPVFVFSGQGKIPNITDLYNTNSFYNNEVERLLAKLEEIDSNIAIHVRKEMFGEGNDIKHTQIDQLAIFISELAYGNLLLSLGIKPQAIIGHSLGEIVGATVSQVFNEEDAIKLVFLRGKVMHELAPTGKMVAIRADSSTIADLAQKYEVAIATLNSPIDIVMSGKDKNVDDLIIHLKQKGIQCTQLSTNRAFHSPDMEKAAMEFEKSISDISFHKPCFPLYSCVYGELHSDATSIGQNYWRRHVMEPVLFYECIKGVINNQPITLIELGCPIITSTVTNKHEEIKTGLVRGSLNGNFTQQSFVTIVSSLWSMNEVEWSEIYQDPELGKLDGLCFERLDKESYWHQVDSIPVAKRDSKIAKEEQRTSKLELNACKDVISSIFSKYIVDHSELENGKFFELGGDSLHLISLIADLNKELGNFITIRDFLKNPTINGVLSCLEKDGTISPFETTNDVIEHIFKDIDSVGEKWPYVSNYNIEEFRNFKTVFLTGSTGFLGAHLLKSLIDKGMYVYCLVRDGNQERIVDVLKHYSLWEDGLSRYFEVITGDLSRENFGLSNHEFDQLSSKVDMVIHSGASVNHAYPLEQLVDINTYSIKTLINLAFRHKLSSLNFISTIDVYELGNHTFEGKLVSLPSPENGYGVSKSLAEHYLYPLMEKGYPINILRPGNIGGSTESYINNKKDALWNWIKAVILTNKCPKSFVESPVPLYYITPVDKLVKTMLNIALESANGQVIANLVPDTSFTSKELLKALEYAGYTNLTPVDDEAWFVEANKYREQGIWVVDNMELNSDTGSSSKESEFLRLPNDQHKLLLEEDSHLPCCDEVMFSKYIKTFDARGYFNLQI